MIERTRASAVGVRPAAIDAATVDAFIAARRAEGASDHTVHKELGTLRRMLDAATRAGTWCGDVRRVMPRFAPNYTPRERFLTVAEVRAILDALSPNGARGSRWPRAPAPSSPRSKVPSATTSTGLDAW